MPELLPNSAPEESKKPGDKKIDPSVYYRASGQGKIKKSSLWRWVIVLAVVIVLIAGGFAAKVILAINSTNRDSGKKISLFEQIGHLIVNPEKQLVGENRDRINILLAGIGGAGHDGAYLADTIILVSLKPSTNEVAMMSIPRDLYVDIPNYGSRKINNALAFGREANYPGGGEALLAQVVSTTFNVPVDYYARLDFAGFRKVIDDLGGIDITIDNSFSDYEYPDYNYGYQTITFKKGTEHMIGERALQFTRSRHGTNGEGSDFARSARQQKVLFAIKEKMLSLHTLTNPAAIVKILNDLGAHNQTNLQLWEISKLAKFSQNISKDQIINQVLDTGSDGLLKSETTLDGAYILTPKAGNFSDLQFLANNIFTSGAVKKENAVVEIQNSTGQAGLGTQLSARLKAMNYNVTKVSNTKTTSPYATTTLYDMSSGQNPNTMNSLKNLLHASITSVIPDYLNTNIINSQVSQNANVNASSPVTDILIIVGTDQITTTSVGHKTSANTQKKI